ncbi:hypothetical protein AAFF_G00147040 [Aldrovandia affinis]|uniref:Uncharacterized protein n=1 Tax=Aldrovandia affinis TaxID=143900 RepID=A0AAD7RSB3_9TELE|nr:hypothetical protein AAFF_G00147040 [Aldrovandia affinis]
MGPSTPALFLWAEPARERRGRGRGRRGGSFRLTRVAKRSPPRPSAPCSGGASLHGRATSWRSAPREARRGQPSVKYLLGEGDCEIASRAFDAYRSGPEAGPFSVGPRPEGFSTPPWRSGSSHQRTALPRARPCPPVEVESVGGGPASERPAGLCAVASPGLPADAPAAFGSL